MNPETLHNTVSDEQRKRKVSYTDDYDDDGAYYAQLLYASPITNIQQQEPCGPNYINGGCGPSIVSCPCVNCDCGWLDQAAINKVATEVPDLDALPIGYRFAPTDEELIRQYLEKKIKNEDVPKARISDADIYEDHPKELVGKYPQAIPDGWYFFTPRSRKYPNGDRPDRQAGPGYWKATGPDKIIKENEKRIGRRKSLIYHEGHGPSLTKTKWMMHEYVIEGYLRRSRLNSNDNKLDDYVLCKIYINGRMKDEVVTDEKHI
ncbi:hypothetical protein M8C21_019304 [Ambrosia artemisiifolia]|uniref:NAC domain-containing protein n=1 Tax=Ambrosia artemisiifolia TaxID=4212 RepID=A0AAD5D1C4_AMBAR|nr:hypothetical protein M8C21_019304 [Ambrosia artemisiifolia]